MSDYHKSFTLDLNLGLGLGSYVQNNVNNSLASSKDELTIGLNHDDKANELSLKRVHEEQEHTIEEEIAIDTTNDSNGCTKKLRLTKEQSTMLEDAFKLHNTINTAQKRALAEKLNLKQRQVEVWFQNRRARTKLKQTEVNYMFLKKCHDKLSEENLILKKELEELRALKVGPSNINQSTKAANWTICSSCKKIWKQNEGHNNEDDEENMVRKSSYSTIEIE
ncbi:homeobox-leucine zipper protein HAT1-like [Trifolium pratense]|uniref:homeobox-leucine zipper protein HAT1-like n=1 Tax=Trifolium pratense TaxID=57577 RepID=UPI001E68FEA7|nr:homeobox-leucine zipper protein HAT1-like [Trifolium pratense]